MIVVDSSALAAIILREQDATSYARAMAAGPTVIGTPTLVELQIVLMRRQVADSAQVIRWTLTEVATTTVAFDEAMVEIAWEAFQQFGKGRHPAKLNYGDCMAYALAKSLDAPLLYKGNDFAQTDIRSALG